MVESRTAPLPPTGSAPPPAMRARAGYGWGPRPGLYPCLGSSAPSGRPTGVDKSPTCTASPAMSSGRPPARGPSAEGGLESARADAAGGAAPRPSLARCTLRPAALGPAWPGLRRAAPSGPSGCRMGHVSAEVRAWGGGGAGAGLPAAPGACSREWGPSSRCGAASAPRSMGDSEWA